ncbi:LacI family transcriptional regulator [Microcella alkaliphila]|uniref:LacI family transcriptional regulator n=1 Tax=Microcella alkaliphila TaxID=279828 RepID=A0A4Q7TZ23_9MICO|nr:LacI family DNA-binding transcriptional regulator [Microcella alkaliphila]RZT66431.1 LacI family transcriptional regulator [Microcella alkaliphila]
MTTTTGTTDAPEGESEARRATLRDVATLAGVSIATASKALNERAHVRESTRDRVLAAATELAFTPNQAARSLTSGQTGTVGLIADDLDGRFSLPILMGAEDAFGTGQVSVFLCDARGDAIRERYHLDALLRRKVDGIIVVGARTDARPPLVGRIPVPVIYAYAPSTDTTDVSVVPDDVQAGRDAVSHLLSAGRQRIAHISGDAAYTAAQERATGIASALEAAGLELVGGSAQFGAWSEQWGRGAAQRVIDQYPEVDGMICGNDQISRGALETLQRSGWNVPHQTSVIGFDNWEVMTTGPSPTLSSIDLNLEQLGRTAAELLFESIQGQVEPGIRRITPRVVTRESS